MNDPAHLPIPGIRNQLGELEEGILEDVRTVLQSGILSQGRFIDALEREFERITQCKFALSVSSGGCGLELILEALDLQGREVILPSDTFVASANAIVRAGGVPVFAEIRPEDLCLDPVDVAHRITDQTAGILHVHMFGTMSSGLDDLLSTCDERGLFLVEDAAHAHGAEYKGIPAGSIGVAGCFSFYGTKIVACGEGGMVTTSRPDIRDRVAVARNHGRSLNSALFEVSSNNFRLGEIPAILALHQARQLEANIQRRNEIAASYSDAFTSNSEIRTLRPTQNARHAYWRYPAILEPGIDRDIFQAYLSDQFGIRATWMYSPACHQQPVFHEYARDSAPLPTTEDLLGRLICLPCYPGLTESEISRVIEGVQEGLDQLA